MLSQIMDHPAGRVFISVLLGLGLATLFRQVCKGNSCIIVKSPDVNEISKNYYKIEDDCFKYTPYTVKCSTHV